MKPKKVTKSGLQPKIHVRQPWVLSILLHCLLKIPRLIWPILEVRIKARGSGRGWKNGNREVGGTPTPARETPRDVHCRTVSSSENPGQPQRPRTESINSPETTEGSVDNGPLQGRPRGCTRATQGPLAELHMHKGEQSSRGQAARDATSGNSRMKREPGAVAQAPVKTQEQAKTNAINARAREERAATEGHTRACSWNRPPLY